MNLQEILQLLRFLDDLFTLGGKLVEAAKAKHPELNTTPLPDLSEMDEARKEATKRASGG